MASHRKRRDPDFLEEVIAEFTAEDPRFPALLTAAAERRRLGRDLAGRRARLGLSQAKIATKMRTSQAQVSKVEAGAPDVRLSTLEWYASAVGREIHVTLRKRSRRAA
jgi:HTH-type transcriptional regulator/antitoxin HipB